MLTVRDFFKSLPHFDLEIPDLTVQEGETFALIGPTGAGKSSFLELLAGFRGLDQGKVLVNGSDVSNLPPDRRHVSILFQQAQLFPHLGVQGNIRYGDRDPILFEQVVELLDLRPLLTKQVPVLSGGERQLVALARALMVRPRVLLLDEPFNAIDPKNRKSVVEAFRRVQRQFHITSLLVTHNLEEALYIAHRLGVLVEGKLLQAGKPEEVFARPASPEIARFLGAENLFAGRIELIEATSPSHEAMAGMASEEDHSLALFRTDSATLHVLANHQGSGYALVHPQDITLSLEEVHSSALNRFRGTVEGIVSRGPIFQLEINAGLTFKVYLTPQSMRDMKLSEGSEVYLTFKASSVKTY